jgi:CMP-N-acetylneuraminic acid synthetase
MKKVTAIITARGGSKGIPRKNVREVCGKPLIAYSIEAALNCSIIDDCYVTTDDREIKDTATLWGAQVIDRPAELASDTALSSDAVAHALQFLQERRRFPDYFVLLQPTSPLRTANHLEECLNGFLQSGMKCAVSITEAEHHPWKMLLAMPQGIQPLQDHHSLESPRQLLPKAYRINGAIYSMSSEIFLKNKSFYIEPAFTYMMSQEDSLDIDSEIDLKILEMILRGRGASG